MCETELKSMGQSQPERSQDYDIEMIMPGTLYSIQFKKRWDMDHGEETQTKQ